MHTSKATLGLMAGTLAVSACGNGTEPLSMDGPAEQSHSLNAEWCASVTVEPLDDLPLKPPTADPSNSALAAQFAAMASRRENPVLALHPPRLRSSTPPSPKAFQVINDASTDLDVSLRSGGGRIVRTWLNGPDGLSLARVMRIDESGTMVANYPAPTGATFLALFQAQAGALDGLQFPEDMPPIEYPDIDCNSSNTVRIQRAWALAHHHTWRMHQLVEFVAEAGTFRDDFWSDGYGGASDENNWSLRNWLGSWDADRLYTVRMVIDDLWDNVRHAEAPGGLQLHVVCPEGSSVQSCGGSAGYHATVGYINVCQGGLNNDYGTWSTDFTDDHVRGKLLVHELMHHQDAKYIDRFGSKIWHPLGDTHFHYHGSTCGSNLDADYMIDIGETLHLSDYGSCKHARRATFNNENYALAIYRLGTAVYSGALNSFPSEGWPNQTGGSPPGPDACDPTSGEGSDSDCVKMGQEWVCPPGPGGPLVVPEQCYAPSGWDDD